LYFNPVLLHICSVKLGHQKLPKKLVFLCFPWFREKLQKILYSVGVLSFC
jgi:hypothetical protein